MNLTIFQTEIYLQDDTINIASGCILLIIFAIYLWFVLRAGPKFMEKRDPYDVTFYVRLYNAAQIVICTLYVVGSWEMGFTFKYLFKCERFDFMTKSQMTQITIAAWLFLGLRVVEFLETIFFVLRKKHNQASFLHIFHHIGSVIQTWLFLVVNAELMAVYIALINSSVHVIMYNYYFYSSFKNKHIQAICQRVKPFITIMQLVQFLIIIAHCVVAVLPNCDFSFYFDLQIFNFIVLFFLFGQFFIKSYVRKGHKGKFLVNP